MKLQSITLTLFAMIPAFLFGNEPLEVGADAPKITVTTHTGETLDLAETYSKGPVLVYFYPKADTPGCTAQACNIRDNFTELQDAGITVLGVSGDDVDDQNAFAEKYELPFTLIADKDKKLGKAFGTESYAGFMYKRQSFLIIDGKLVWKDLKASPKTQTQDALSAFENHTSGDKPS